MSELSPVSTEIETDLWLSVDLEDGVGQDSTNLKTFLKKSRQ